ncbi:MAG TPA: mechanosensitive ion channel family protein [Candidatus Mcinerneyibacteriales bacterium]|nr:mechanosensitive ion channel family protein [Candidatus Mcinerneyibacteriales bacterium]HPE19777.1 mechanosensitive ion channel family protein [Candidatus Mcinerneyibacteriales bacterium]HPJ69263.1 mechanosensitive ion channel family protein [Candidatus Mcinerneyibacteriales bacterium]HPQ88912.1 mechanosensitive ion channel family protein [Candidatus Mcinerneyibacteriales bacterium]
MGPVYDFIQGWTGIDPGLQAKILSTFLVGVIFWLIRLIILHIVNRLTTDIKARYTWRKSLTYITGVLALLIMGSIWLKGIQTLATYLGLLSAGLAIALKDPLTNIAGWLFIISRRPFSMGDRIQIGEYAGDVIDIRVFQFTLIEIGNWVDADQSTGRIIDINNSKIFTDTLANYTKGFRYIWNEIPVLVTFESDWQKAKRLLQKIVDRHAEQLTPAAEKSLREASKKFMIFYSQLTPIVYTSVRESGVLLTMRYMCEPRKRRGSTEAIWEDVLREFSRHKDIDFAYPTTRFYNESGEGKKKQGFSRGKREDQI